MGKSSSQIIGYWYHPAFHMGLGYGPADALLEIRGGDKTAWSGELTASGTITINKPGLFGGEKDQGGIQGDMDVMFGEATQQPNAYLISTFGNQQPAWRGLMTVVFKGGKYGAMNPYPQKISYKWRKIKMGWDGDPGDGSACWYPEKAAVSPTGTGEGTMLVTDFVSGFSTDDAASYQILDNGIANTTHDVQGSVTYYRTPLTLLGVSSFSCFFQLRTLDGGDPIGISLTDSSGSVIIDFQPRAEDLVDPQQRPWVNYRATGIFAAATALAAGRNYQFTAALDSSAGVWNWSLLDGATVLGSGTAPAPSLVPAYLQFYRTGNQHTASIAVFGRVDIQGSIKGWAMNPAHILYYAKTQQHMGREPTANMNDASFTAAADWYYAQGFGLCTTYDASQESIDAFIERIEKVAGCSMTRSPADGLWYLDVANGQYDIDSLPVLTDDDILAFTMQPATLDSAINSVSVQYFDPQQKTTVSTRPVEALALVSAFGRSHQDTSYPEIPTSGLALRVAQRDVQTTVTPTHGFEITATRVAHGWRKGMYFRLKAPKHSVADMVCIVGDPDSGTLASGAIKFTAVEDIYSLPASSFAEQEPGVDTRPSQIPLPILYESAFEAPYFELVRRLSRADLQALPSDAGYLETVAADPATSRNYSIEVSVDGGTTYQDAGGNGPWCPTAQVVEGDTLQDHAPSTSFTLANGTLLASVQVGSAALWIGESYAEMCRVDAIDAVNNTLTLGRGCLDTPPCAHAANDRIWFFDGFTGTDNVEYTAGETLNVRLLTNTGSDQLPLSLAAAIPPLTFAQRQDLPYPPAGLKIDGSFYPAAVIGPPLTLTWVERNRLTQADQLVDTSMATVAPEAGTTYTLRVYLNGELDSTTTGITATTASPTVSGFGPLRIEIDAVRDGVASWKPLSASFNYQRALAIATTSPINRTQGVGGTVQLQSVGGIPPVTWSVDPSTPLPGGMTMDDDGLITDDGTALPGNTDCDFTVEDSAGTSVSKTITIAVAATESWLDFVDSLSPVAHWRMDDAVGSTYLNDRIGNEHAMLAGTAGTSYVLGSAGMISGDTDTAVVFNGGYAQTGAAQKWSLGTGDYSIFLIGKWTYGSFETILYIRDSGSANLLGAITINRVSTGQVGAEAWNWNSEKLLTSDKDYNDGKPHAIGVTYEADTNTMRLYVDGALKVTQVQSGPQARPTAATMKVNIAANNGIQVFSGTLDEIILLDKKLSDDDMAALASYVSTT